MPIRPHISSNYLLIVTTFALMMVGCGENPNSRFAGKLDMIESSASESDLAATADAVSRQGQSLANITNSTVQTDEEELAEQSAEKNKTKRRIIYNTSLGLIVKTYSEFETSLPRLVKSVDGFISKSQTDRRYND
ncbi:hypothetical protein, membrane or secreted, partial [Rhodopirellula maiorica SM1]